MSTPPNKVIDDMEFEKFTEEGSAAVRTRPHTILMENDAGTGNILYIGLANIGTATSAAFWQIRKLSYDGAGYLASVKWAGGNAKFDNVWDNRASFTYT